MLSVNKSSWHYKVYRWWYQSKYGEKTWDWDKQEYVDHEPSTSNLCPYMRAVMFWSWMRWLFIRGKIKKVPVPAIAWLIVAVEVPRMCGMFSYQLKSALFLLEFIALCFAAMVLLMAGISYAYANKGWFHWFGWTKTAYKAFNEFGGLVRDYSRAKHDMVCPAIEFKG